jgi:phospholipid-binding lipoprotein MlaA
MAVSGLVVRSDIEPTLTNIMTQSTDPYATIRSSYLQNRESLVREATGEVQMLPDFDDLDAVNGPAADLPPHVAATTEYHLAQPVTLAHE